MIGYRSEGRLPPKPHTVFRDGSGDAAGPKGSAPILHEHCFTSVGFDGPFAILYHRNPPQAHGAGRLLEPLWPMPEPDAPLRQQALRRRHLRTPELPNGGTPTRSRVPLLFNADLTVGVVRPDRADDDLFANGDGDELFYIHQGGGELRSTFGRLPFRQGDYVFVPRGTLHRLLPGAGPQHWLWMELRSGMHLPKQYRNPIGQLRMDAPYTGRDFEAPRLPAEGPIDPDLRPGSDGGYRAVSKRADRFTAHRYLHDPLDVVGWDGAYYPFRFPILAFQPKIGQVHLPPTVHGTFATGGSLICSFVPRRVDFHPAAIPCPYPHSNLEVDEVLFYCDGDFTSRRGIDAGSVSLHPAGVPHGPHPGAYEASIGTDWAGELAVMIDTFEPLQVTPQGAGVEQTGYDESWGIGPGEEDA